MHPLRFTALECFGLCGLFLFLGLFAGYAWGVWTTRRYHRRVFDDLRESLEERAMIHIIEKAEWITSLMRAPDSASVEVKEAIERLRQKRARHGLPGKS